MCKFIKTVEVLSGDASHCTLKWIDVTAANTWTVQNRLIQFFISRVQLIKLYFILFLLQNNGESGVV